MFTVQITNLSILVLVQLGWMLVSLDGYLQFLFGHGTMCLEQMDFKSENSGEMINEYLLEDSAVASWELDWSVHMEEFARTLYNVLGYGIERQL